MHLQFIEPAKRYADIIVPQGGQNKVAIDILSSRIKAHINRDINEGKKTQSTHKRK
jgi:uridine kinase